MKMTWHLKFCCLCKDFMFSYYSPQSGGYHKINNDEISPSKDERNLTESQKIPHTLMTDQCNGTTAKHGPIPPSAPHSYETANKKTKCTTKKPQAYLKYSSNIEVSVKLIRSLPEWFWELLFCITFNLCKCCGCFF